MPLIRLVGFVALMCVTIELWERGIIQWGIIIFGCLVALYLVIKNMRPHLKYDRLVSIPMPMISLEPNKTTEPLSRLGDNRLYTKIDQALNNISPSILDQSGSVFYSGRSAFYGHCPLYVLGLNPGGSPSVKTQETVRADIAQFRHQFDNWSAYMDESWEGKTPGTQGMQPRVLHLFRQLKLHPHSVPCSNVVFVRSRNEAELDSNKIILLNECLPIHTAVIAATTPKVILCFGAAAGLWMRRLIQANRLLDEYRETNNRGWKSQAHVAEDKRIVITATHPSRANWCNPDSDPTDLVKRCLDRF